MITLRTDWVCHDDMAFVLRLLTPANALAIELALDTGLRIGDVLAIETDVLRKGQRISVLEHKTGKTKRVYIPKKLHTRLLMQAGVRFVFQHRTDPMRHRTRQAVWADVKRAAKALRIKSNVAPHSSRKVYAVQVYKEKGLEACRQALNHSDVNTTLIYLLSELVK